ncbi:methionyl-tRNA formyltransferase [Leptospira sp. GIMC2001]|uniref:methionyl-tRNA formyltransferase n=1 Tax=Leptospira sp. GIMC2001 TaxID=1513297 RepID=UPI0023496A02|nr:methionyl-tRNA formyltransferase [Leptospira sp. GIMC2001]WCL47917.1 methionyl-tRNA formyltransferase [Leptospira sp. GIMC2001]
MKIGFFGTPEHAKDLLKILKDHGNEIGFVVTNPDKPQGRKKELVPSPVKKYALENGIPVFQPIKIKQEPAIQEILSIAVDIHIVYAYGSIIPEIIFTSPKFGSMNLHGSLLPELRGASPVQSAILLGYKKTGFTIQYLANEVDSGDIIAQEEFEISDSDTTDILLNRITDLGGKAILRILEEINQTQKPSSSIPQDNSKATFCGKFKSEDRLLDFTQSAESIHNRIRAFYPNPIAMSGFRGKKILIHKSYLEKDTTVDSPPGTVYLKDKKSLFVICGDKKMIGIGEIQPEGKKPMAVSEFLNGINFLEGERFD